MESDEFYDSLDDENAYHTPDALTTTSERNQIEELNSEFSTECDISSVVPLYDGETLKEHVKIAQKPKIKANKKIRKAIQTITLKDKIVKKEVVAKDQNIKASGADINKTPFVFNEPITYSKLFYNRLNLLNPGKLKPKETTRGRWGDSTDRTDVSDVSSHFSDAKSTISDTTSFYFDLLKKSEPERPALNNKSIPVKKADTESLDHLDFNLHSVSQFSMATSTFSINSKRSHTKSSLMTPVLGCLGPDTVAIQEKLSLLKKRRNYGQKVSDQNRIKMKEMKILKDIKTDEKKTKT